MKNKKNQINVPLFYCYSDIKCAISKKEVLPHEGDHTKAKYQVKKLA